jgi:hypothetical protein
MSITLVAPVARNARAAALAMCRATLLLGILLGLGFLYVAVRAAVDPLWLEGIIAIAFPGAPPLSSPAALLVIASWAVAQVVALAVALLAVWRTFAALAGSEVLVPGAGIWLRRAGLALVASAALMMSMSPVVSFAISMNAPAGQRFVTLSLGSGEITTLFVGGMLVALGHVLRLAAEINEDSRQIV